MAAEFALDGDMGAFGEGAGEIGEFPKATHRCHPVRDSQDPAPFFQDVLVASEKKSRC